MQMKNQAPLPNRERLSINKKLTLNYSFACLHMCMGVCEATSSADLKISIYVYIACGHIALEKEMT